MKCSFLLFIPMYSPKITQLLKVNRKLIENTKSKFYSGLVQSQPMFTLLKYNQMRVSLSTSQ